ncbi:MAG TPA: UbiA family prenyltransferase [Chitinispirillaceae bacterium]|nr:UbiA family prenyltransferase [Chitinispirillaceae bacterium]
MIPSIIPFIKIIRPANAVMAAGAAMLGYWISDASLQLLSLILLIVATITAIGFGNVINDILDIKTDRISHPDRPLPKGELSSRAAVIYSILLCVISLLCARLVSVPHLLATVIPIALLIVYSFFLKGTPLSGNLLVGILVAYPLLYGGISGINFNHLIIPAMLAFLLNLAREIIKDIHDKEGDSASGIITSASLPDGVINVILYATSIVYLSMIFIPVWLKHMGYPYLIVCVIATLPIHFFRTNKLLRLKRDPDACTHVALLYKLEMFTGLGALLADKIFN